MRYPDSGGLTARERAAREQVRFEAAGMFEQDADPVQIARELRGEHQVGVCVAAGVAGWWPGRFGVEGAGRGEVPSVAGAAGPAARGAGGRPGRAWVGRPAVDTGAGRRADRPVVQGAVVVAGDFDIDHLAAIIKTRLRSIQHRPWLFAGFLAQTGLTLDPQPP
jgi:hypothetical protein